MNLTKIYDKHCLCDSIRMDVVISPKIWFIANNLGWVQAASFQNMLPVPHIPCEPSLAHNERRMVTHWLFYSSLVWSHTQGTVQWFFLFNSSLDLCASDTTCNFFTQNQLSWHTWCSSYHFILCFVYNHWPHHCHITPAVPLHKILHNSMIF